MQVHPDHFSAHPKVQKANSDSLKLLNNYVDEIAGGRWIRSAVMLEFHVKVVRGTKAKPQDAGQSKWQVSQIINVAR